ncbi:MAG: hypothetical protein GY795_51790 [Desulfobacterales bacterium]|nr:hypothetical protein [Desulfobacterales bacterium]
MINTQKIRKLMAMPRHEVFFRILEKKTELAEFIKYTLGMNKLHDNEWINKHDLKSAQNIDKQLYEDFWNGKRDRFFTEAYDKKKRLELIKTHFDYTDWIAEAEKIWKGDIQLLGQNMKIPASEGWHVDPLENEKWPDTFYKHAEKTEYVKTWDIKYIWELNRHQYLIVLGKAYWITGDEKYADRVFSIIQNWITENPYHTGVNWTSSLELAVRTISWIWACFLCQDSVHLTPEIHKNFMKSVYEHGKYIANHLSYYSSPYNHLIGEAAALHLIGCLFPRFRQGEQWEKQGWNILAGQVGKQFHPDGMCVEQASFYHHFTLGFYLQAILLRRLNNKEVSPEVLSLTEKASEFSMYLTKPDGTLPMIGDIDNARSLFFNSKHSWDFRSFLGIGAILFNRPDFKAQCLDFPEEIFWLCSDEDIGHFLNMEKALPRETSKAFYNSGYFISRDSWKNNSHYLCFDCGEISEGLAEGPIPSAAHGHADTLSFDLSAYGKPFIIDGGFYTYFGNIDWHKYFRHEQAHNTIKIDHYQQAEYCGRLKWQNTAKPRLNKWITTRDYDFVSGSIEYDKNMQHLRQIAYIREQFWLLNDFIVSDNDTRIESYLHFSPEADVMFDENNRQLIASIDNTGILIRYFTDAGVEVETGGKDDPSKGWAALGYGIRTPASRVKFTWNAVSSKRGLFPVIIIPWQKEYDSVQFEEAKWNLENRPLFRTAFSRGKKHFTVDLDRDFSIRVSGEDSVIQIP